MFFRPSVAAAISQAKPGALKTRALCSKKIDIESKQESGMYAALNSLLNQVTMRDSKAKKAYEDVVTAEKDVAQARKEFNIVSKKIVLNKQLPEKEKIIENYKAKKVVEEAEKKLDEARKKKSAAEIALRFSVAKLAIISAKAVGGYLGIAAVVGLGSLLFHRVASEFSIVYYYSSYRDRMFVDPWGTSLRTGLFWPLPALSAGLQAMYLGFSLATSQEYMAKWAVRKASKKLDKAVLRKKALSQKSLSKEEYIIKEYEIDKEIKKINEEIKKAQKESDEARAGGMRTGPAMVENFKEVFGWEG